MPETPSPASSEDSAKPISVDELIRGQLAGKLIALARYDEIIWKVRAGYVAVVYGMLAFFVGKESKLTEVLNSADLLHGLLPIAVSLSVCAFLVDVAFVLSKLRVVAARNRLSDIAMSRAAGHELRESEIEELATLLHLSGEALTIPPFALLVSGLWPLFALYFVTPIAIRLIIP